MPDTHYAFNRNLPAGFRLGRAHEALDLALKGIPDERDTMLQMRSGDGTQDAHYTAVTAAYGFTSDAEAHAAFLELDTVNAQLLTISATVKQFLARLRS